MAKNDKRGWDVTNNKVVKYAEVDHESGAVLTADGWCVGNYMAGDFMLECESQNASTSESALPISDVVEMCDSFCDIEDMLNGGGKCKNCGTEYEI